jgi:DNA-binding PadR family transcriptional regulator
MHSCHWEHGCDPRRERWNFGRRGGWGGSHRHGPPDWFFDFFGPPPRADRGNVRYLVLDAIATQARHGYEIIQSIEERSKGAYRPSPGVIYPTLQLLEELGHARVVEQESRKVFSITEEGTRDLEAHRSEVAEFYERFEDRGWEEQAEHYGDVIKRAAQLFKTFKRAARRGGVSLAAQAKVRKIMDEAVQQIEKILEEDARL